MLGDHRGERGLLSLEASIALTIFIFLMLFMYSFFVVFEARNTMGHAVLATANSLSLDAYDTSLFVKNKLDEKRDVSVEAVRNIFRAVYGSAGREDSQFISHDRWFDQSKGGSTSGEFEETVRTRFLAYLGGGDTDHAAEVLELYHIKDGVDGLDFSASYTDSDNLHLSVKYTIDYEFHVFNLEMLEMEQTACSKLWK